MLGQVQLEHRPAVGRQHRRVEAGSRPVEAGGRRGREAFRQEKDVVAANVARILRRAGGIWITPDLSPLSFLDRDAELFKVFAPLIAGIEARTGREVWRTVKADFAKGYTHTAGPVIADGVVVSGINGCERFKKEGCFITGHDPETGRELWRTSTIALPPDPNDASWGKIPPELRGGATILGIRF